MKPFAREQARNALPDAKLLAHYKDSGIFNRRGLAQDQLKNIRDDWYSGTPVPMWSVPPGTDVAIYRSADSTSPDLIGRIVGHPSRVPKDENGNPGLSFEVPYVRVRANDGKIYEYPALLSGSNNAPHVRHSSFAALDPISKGQEGIATLGWGFPNFAEDEDAGPSSLPDDFDLFIGMLATNMQRSVGFADAVEARNKKRDDAMTNEDRTQQEYLDNVDQQLSKGVEVIR